MKESWDDIWNLRTSLYGFLANSLLDPIQGLYTVTFTRKFWEDFPVECANSQMNSGLEQLLDCSSKLESLSDEEAKECVMVEYTELFIGPGLPKAPPWESLYRTNEKIHFGWTTYEMKKWLHENGLESKRKNSQPEDHIGLQLMLLSVLTQQITTLERDQQVFKIRDQISFIDEHLLSWIHELCRDAKENGTIGFYSGLIELVWGILLWDKELIQEFLESSEMVAVSSI
jgi:putative dimethyl sulfoxide reductase chaperone